MKKDKFITDFQDIPTPRQKMPHLSLEDRKLNFKEVELGFPEEIALKETSRCLSCRRCIGCGLCLAECDQQAIVYDQKSESRTLEVDSIVVATGAENFDARRKPEFGYSYFPNVITSVEMERILSANGPYGGIVMRPSDGDIPQRIAFIQCVGSRDENLGQNYCSNICCVTALKQSMAVVDRIEGAEVTIFYSDFRPFANDGEHYFLKAKQEKAIAFVQAAVAQVEQTSEGNNLVIKSMRNGAEELSQFDLVVLSTGLKASTGIQRMSRQFGIKLNKYGFFPGDETSPAATSGDGIWFAGTLTSPSDIQTSLNQASAVATRVLLSLKQRDKLLQPAQTDGDVFAEKENGNSVGIFLCRYGLTTQFNLDVDDIIRSLKNNPAGFYVTDLEYCCNSTGKKMIRETIGREKLGRAVIAPCFDETHRPFFEKVAMSAGMSGAHVSIYGNAAGERQPDAEEVKQAILDVASAPMEQPIRAASLKPSVKEACVIGGSVEAVQAALDIAELGYPVHLVYPDDNVLPDDSAAFWHVGELDKLGERLRERLAAQTRIGKYGRSSVRACAGEPGNYVITIGQDGEEKTIKAGVVVLAPGAKPAEPLEHFTQGRGNVFTQRQLSRMLSENTLSAKNIVMIQCVGSRDEKRSYCSQVCCEQAILNALKIREKHADARVTILHRDIRLHDFAEDKYAEALENGVAFIRMDAYPEIASTGENHYIRVLDRKSGKPVELAADALVLSVGMEPRPDVVQLASIFNQPLNPDGLLLNSTPLSMLSQWNQPAIFKIGQAVYPARLRDVLAEAAAVAGKIGQLFGVE
ncbi:MAG: hypothetical protein ACOY90_20990 [Candidatus Zhuqueibacterota bacterium]